MFRQQPLTDREGAEDFIKNHTPEGDCRVCGKQLSYFWHYKKKMHMPPVAFEDGHAHWNCWYAVKRMNGFLKQELITTAKASSLRVHRKTAIFGNVEKIPIRGRREHGVSRRDPELYQRLVVLQELKMIWRRGYSYYPSYAGWRVYFRILRKPQEPTCEDGVRWERVFTGALQKRFQRHRQN